MTKYLLRIFASFVLICSCFVSRTSACPNDDSGKRAYDSAFSEIESMLHTNQLSFKKAVFAVENAFFYDTLSYDLFQDKIQYLAFLVKEQYKSISLNSYSAADSDMVRKNLAIFEVLKDTCKIIGSGKTRYHLPFTYDFDDFFGNEKWTNMFVTKLLVTNKGNCHSLPYLYKMLSDEMGVRNAWLSFAPNHIYIKNHCQQTGWYNTELTSGQFPIDGWIMASGYVSPDAVRSGIYMDTLSDQELVANCALDLAKGYEKKYRTYTDSFIIKCCDLTLKYHPNNINAIIYKAETLKKMYLNYKNENFDLATKIYLEMENLYVHALDLGYKEMPEKMYREWLVAISKEKGKYSN